VCRSHPPVCRNPLAAPPFPSLQRGCFFGSFRSFVSSTPRVARLRQCSTPSPFLSRFAEPLLRNPHSGEFKKSFRPRVYESQIYNGISVFLQYDMLTPDIHSGRSLSAVLSPFFSRLVFFSLLSIGFVVASLIKNPPPK